MRANSLIAAVAAVSLAPFAQSLNILLNNDDGWASANIREFYRLLKASGHNVLMVAPIVDNSGQGGRVGLLVFIRALILSPDSPSLLISQP